MEAMASMRLELGVCKSSFFQAFETHLACEALPLADVAKLQTALNGQR
jgi:hypothetical protein